MGSFPSRLMTTNGEGVSSLRENQGTIVKRRINSRE